jgi:hypothetical protein
MAEREHSPDQIKDELEAKLFRHLRETPVDQLQASMVNAVVSYLKAFPPSKVSEQEKSEIKSRMGSMGMTIPFPKKA